MTKPLAIDLFCGLGGWTEGLLAEGWEVAGFDIERHQYGTEKYPGKLILQDVRTITGAQLRRARLIVASSPCQAYSYMAMPWTRAKQIAAALRGLGPFPDGYKGATTIAELNELFEQPARIQREASEAAGWSIPMVQENVRGAQPWVGPSRWHHGSFHLWGDVPAMMPPLVSRKNSGGSWFTEGNGAKIVRNDPRDGAIKQGGDWFSDRASAGRQGGISLLGGRSPARKAASARIAKIPFVLASHIGHAYHPDRLRGAA